jgi:hypothetical protein
LSHHRLTSKLGSSQREDAFAIFVALDTAILINDASAESDQVWQSLVGIVRDCVDIVLGYRDDMDFQLFTSKTTGYSLTESAKHPGCAQI